MLLLDEPLSALDYKLRKEMQIELKRLQHETGITFIFVTHDQEEALTMSDRIAVMSSGNILQVGTPRDIYDRPAERFVADFIGETNFLTGTIESIAGNGKANVIVLSSGARICATAAEGLPAERPGDRCGAAGACQAGQGHLAIWPARSRTSSISAPTRISMSGWTAASLSSCASRIHAARELRLRKRRQGRHLDRRRRRADC